MPRFRLEGIFVPHITPFTRKDEVDLEALRTCVKFWISNGVSGLVPCGSNGEAPYLSRQERSTIIETVVEEVDGKIPVVAGTGSMSTRDTIAFTQDAKDLGVDAALVVTPFYFKLSKRELLEHYRAVLEAVDLPIVIYNVPKFTGFSLDPTVVSQLIAECSNVVGVKESSGNSDTIDAYLKLVGNKVSILAGAADVTLSTLMKGGKGAVLAVANVFPKLCCNLYEALRNGNIETARQLQERISYTNEVLVKKHSQLSAIKEAMRLQDLSAGYPRKPALPLEREEAKEIEEMLKTFQTQAQNQ